MGIVPDARDVMRKRSLCYGTYMPTGKTDCKSEAHREQPPFSKGDMFQDTLWIPETMDNTESYRCYCFL